MAETTPSDVLFAVNRRKLERLRRLRDLQAGPTEQERRMVGPGILGPMRSYTSAVLSPLQAAAGLAELMTARGTAQPGPVSQTIKATREELERRGYHGPGGWAPVLGGGALGGMAMAPALSVAGPSLAAQAGAFGALSGLQSVGGQFSETGQVDPTETMKDTLGGALTGAIFHGAGVGAKKAGLEGVKAALAKASTVGSTSYLAERALGKTHEDAMLAAGQNFGFALVPGDHAKAMKEAKGEAVRKAAVAAATERAGGDPEVARSVAGSLALEQGAEPAVIAKAATDAAKVAKATAPPASPKQEPMKPEDLPAIPTPELLRIREALLPRAGSQYLGVKGKEAEGLRIISGALAVEQITWNDVPPRARKLLYDINRAIVPRAGGAEALIERLRAISESQRAGPPVPKPGLEIPVQPGMMTIEQDLARMGPPQQRPEAILPPETQGEPNAIGQIVQQESPLGEYPPGNQGRPPAEAGGGDRLLGGPEGRSAPPEAEIAPEQPIPVGGPEPGPELPMQPAMMTVEADIRRAEMEQARREVEAALPPGETLGPPPTPTVELMDSSPITQGSIPRQPPPVAEGSPPGSEGAGVPPPPERAAPSRSQDQATPFLRSLSKFVVVPAAKSVRAFMRTRPVRYDAMPVLETIREFGPVSKEFVSRGHDVLDARERFRHEIADDYAAAIESVNPKLYKAKNLRAVSELKEVIPIESEDTPTYGYTKREMVMERMLPVESLGADAQRSVRAIAKVYEKLGQLYERAEVPQYDPTTKTWEPFRHRPGGMVSHRVLNDLGYSIFRGAENDPRLQVVARAIAHANGWDSANVGAAISVMRRAFAIRKGPMETTRVIPNFPSHYDFGNGLEPIMETNPMRSLVRHTEGALSRLGYLEVMGSGLPKTATGFPEMGVVTEAEKSTAATGNELLREAVTNGYPREWAQKKIEEAFRVLNGQPRSEYRPEDFFGKALVAGYRNTFGVVSPILKMMWISGSTGTIAAEPLSGPLAISGGRRWAAAWKDVFSREDGTPQLARQFAARQLTTDWTIEPERAAQQISKIASSIGLQLSLNPQVHNLQKVHAASAMLLMAADLKAGNGNNLDRARLRALRYSPEQIETMISGNASDELYQSLARRGRAFTQQSGKHPAEVSPWGQFPGHGDVTFADSYFRTKMNQIAVFADDLATTYDKRDWRAYKASLRLSSNYLFGNIAQGVTTSFIKALQYGGPIAGARMWVQTAEEHKKHFVTEAVKYSMMSGQADVVWRHITGDSYGPLTEELIDSVVPVSVINEAQQMIRGTGRYAYSRGVTEKAYRFMTTNAPGLNSVVTWAATVGIGSNDPNLKVAMRGLYDWKRKELGQTFSREETKRSNDFHYFMRRAAEEMKRTDQNEGKKDEKIAGLLNAALSSDAKATPRMVESSIRRRSPFVVGWDFYRHRPIEMSEEQLASLKKSVGDDSFETLKHFDGILQRWADSYMFVPNVKLPNVQEQIERLSDPHEMLRSQLRGMMPTLSRDMAVQ